MSTKRMLSDLTGLPGSYSKSGDSRRFRIANNEDCTSIVGCGRKWSEAQYGSATSVSESFRLCNHGRHDCQ